METTISRTWVGSKDRRQDCCFDCNIVKPNISWRIFLKTRYFIAENDLISKKIYWWFRNQLYGIYIRKTISNKWPPLPTLIYMETAQS